MKRSFYEMLEVPRQATQEQIDDAYHRLREKLEKTTSVRGTAEAMTELNMIREGYGILSNPEKRAVYDAKLYATEKGIDLVFFPKDEKAVKKLGVNSVVFAALACVLTYMVYQKFTRETGGPRVDTTVDVAKPKAAVPVPEMPKADVARAEAVNAEAAKVESLPPGATIKPAQPAAPAADAKGPAK